MKNNIFGDNPRKLTEVIQIYPEIYTGLFIRKVRVIHISYKLSTDFCELSTVISSKKVSGSEIFMNG